MYYIYKIDIKDKMYVGSTRNLKRRIYDHNYCARHPNQSKPSTYPIYKYCHENSITFLRLDIIEKCDDAQHLEREQYYIDFYRQTHDLLNDKNCIFNDREYRKHYMREYRKANRERLNAQRREIDAKKRAEAKLTPS